MSNYDSSGTTAAPYFVTSVGETISDGEIIVVKYEDNTTDLYHFDGDGEYTLGYNFGYFLGNTIGYESTNNEVEFIHYDTVSSKLQRSVIDLDDDTQTNILLNSNPTGGAAMGDFDANVANYGFGVTAYICSKPGETAKYCLSTNGTSDVTTEYEVTVDGGDFEFLGISIKAADDTRLSGTYTPTGGDPTRIFLKIDTSATPDVIGSMTCSTPLDDSYMFSQRQSNEYHVRLFISQALLRFTSFTASFDSVNVLEEISLVSDYIDSTSEIVQLRGD